jgi:hypothetical protein
MSGWKAALLALLLAAGFTYGLFRLFGMQLAAGSVYPEGSSLRTDPLGSKLLFDSLARMPGIQAARSYLPLEFSDDSDATILLLSVDPRWLDSEPDLKTIEKIASRGNRIAVAVNAEPIRQAPEFRTLARLWHVRFGVDISKKHVHNLFFSEATDWRVRERIGEKMLAIERSFGKGSVVLFSESDDFTNESTAALDRLDMVSIAIGANRRVIFDEQHFGIQESGSVIGLARKYRLTGLGLGLAICAVLFVWKNAAQFPPPVMARRAERLVGRTSLSGLVTLLHRNIPPSRLAAECWQQWVAANRKQVSPERLRRVEEALRSRTAAPLDAVREIQVILQAKGEL